MHEQANLHANTYVFCMHYTFFDFFVSQFSQCIFCAFNFCFFRGCVAKFHEAKKSISK